jgi:hypothetical protein
MPMYARAPSRRIRDDNSTVGQKSCFISSRLRKLWGSSITWSRSVRRWYLEGSIHGFPADAEVRSFGHPSLLLQSKQSHRTPRPPTTTALLKRKQPQPKLKSADRLFWTTFGQCLSGWTYVSILVITGTVIGWRRSYLADKSVDFLQVVRGGVVCCRLRNAAVAC